MHERRRSSLAAVAHEKKKNGVTLVIPFLKRLQSFLCIHLLLVDSMVDTQSFPSTSSDTFRHRKLVLAHPDEVIPGCYVVELQSSPDGQHREADNFLRDYPNLMPRLTYKRALQGFAACIYNTSTLYELFEDERVLRIGQDGTLLEENENKRSALQTQQMAPYHLDRIDGNVDNMFEYGYNGTGVTVYILDSGIHATHTEFEHRLDVSCFAPTSADCFRDENSHGTHIAGIVGGTTHGIAKGVRLHNVRVRNADNQLTWSNIFAGLDYVLVHAASQQSRVIICNLSISGRAHDQADAIAQAAMDAGVTLVVAAGNQEDDACARSPARLPDAIAVAASSYERGQDFRRDLSNTGPCVTIWAPGSDIWSADTQHDNSFSVKSGTSMAAPLVSGALALYAQAGLSIHHLLADAEWIDALADGETTGLFLSLLALNQRAALDVKLAPTLFPTAFANPASPRLVNPVPTVIPLDSSPSPIKVESFSENTKFETDNQPKESLRSDSHTSSASGEAESSLVRWFPRHWANSVVLPALTITWMI